MTEVAWKLRPTGWQWGLLRSGAKGTLSKRLMVNWKGMYGTYGKCRRLSGFIYHCARFGR